jgi:hypothetical protein
MWVLHLRLGFHLKIILEWTCMHVLQLSFDLHSKALELHIKYFEATLHVSIAFKVGFSLKFT